VSRQGQRGSASVLATVLVVALVVATVLVAAVGAVVADQRRVASAADLAALAGAAALQAGREGCAAAGLVARRNAARMTSCIVSGSVVTVGTTRRTRPLLGRRLTVRSSARAGPAEVPG
jgi:secretion/DNA translocation related TadE-like protein